MVVVCVNDLAYGRMKKLAWCCLYLNFLGLHSVRSSGLVYVVVERKDF